MIDFLSLWYKKELRFIVINIILFFSVVPYSIFKYSYFVLVFFLILEFFLILNDKPGISILVLAYSVVIPYVEAKTGISFYIPYIGVFLALFLYIIIKKKKVFYSFNFSVLLIPMLFVMSLFWGFNNSTFEEPKIMLLFILSTFGIFCITFYDKLKLSQFYILLDLIFYLTCVYALMEFFLKFSPYQLVYKDLPFDYQLRTKGLLGHPLVFSAFLSLYFSALLSKVIIYKKWNIFNFVLLLLMIILSASRTGLVLVGIAILLYVILNKAYKKVSFLIGLVFVLTAIFFTLPFINDSLELTAISRILDASTDQRSGSYGVAFDIFLNNILGIGISIDALKHEVSAPGSHYALNSNYDKSFVIFDNTYLTGLVAYGVLSAFLYVIFISPLKFAFKYLRRGEDRKYGISVILVFVIWFLQNLSFDSIFYFPINAMFFVLCALFIKEGVEQANARNIPMSLYE